MSMLGEYLENQYLGWKCPPANTIQTLVTAPTSTTLIIDTLFVNNLDSQNSPDSITVRINRAGYSANGDQFAILNNYPIAVHESVLKGKIVLNSGDSISIRASKGHTSFQCFGTKDPRNTVIDALKNQVVAGTISPTGAAQLMLLTGGSYVINTNNCGS